MVATSNIFEWAGFFILIHNRRLDPSKLHYESWNPEPSGYSQLSFSWSK